MAFNFISNARKTKNNVIPFYLNAKLISPSDQGFFEKSGAYSHLSDVIVEKLYSSIPNLINYLKRDDLTEFLDLFMKLGVDRAYYLSMALMNVRICINPKKTRLLKNSVTKCKRSVILSCRTTSDRNKYES